MNAEVTMPIAQLDELRNDLKKAQEENKLLIANKAKIQLTVELQEQVRDYAREYEEESYNMRFRTNYRSPWDNTIANLNFPTSVQRFKTVKTEIHQSFQNVDSFIEPFTEIAREKVRGELDQAEKVASTAVQDLARAKGVYANAEAELIEKHDKKVFELTTKYKDEVKRLEEIIESRDKTIKELKNEAVLLSKDEEIDRLKTDLSNFMKAITEHNKLGLFQKLTKSVEYPELTSVKKK